MAISITAVGVVSETIDGTTVTLTGVQLLRGEAAIVGLAFDNGAGPPAVSWDGHALTLVGYEIDAPNGIALAVYWLQYATDDYTRDMVATWPAPIASRVMAVSAIRDANVVDAVISAAAAISTAPVSGFTGTLTESGECMVAFFGGNGPDTDTPGIPAAGVMAQRIGTADLTLEQLVMDMATADPVQAELTGSASRTWKSVAVAVRASGLVKRGISPSDVMWMANYFEKHGWDESKHAFHYSPVYDRWEVYEVVDFGPLRAAEDPATGWPDA